MKSTFLPLLLALSVMAVGCGKTASVKSGSKSDSAKSASAKSESLKSESLKSESAKSESAKSASAKSTAKVDESKTDEAVAGVKTEEVELTEAEMVKAELAKLSPEDRAIAEKQVICPLAKKPLGYMLGMKKVDLGDGKLVFVCCGGCEGHLRKNPEKWLANLEWYQGMPESKEKPAVDVKTAPAAKTAADKKG